jgi:hypothetical protein
MPRPASDSKNVPLATSIFIQLATPDETNRDTVVADSVAVSLRTVGAEGGEWVPLLQSDERFAPGVSGWVRFDKPSARKARPLSVYIEPSERLQPETTYEVRVQARSTEGGELPQADGIWRFTTAVAPKVHTVQMPLNLDDEPVDWHGRFFSGICNVVFCSSEKAFGPTYELMDAVRREHPRAWSYQRDFWLTGTDGGAGFHVEPNIVRERETRRITATEVRPDGVLLRVEDVFGHEQYGVPSDQPVSEDYHPGDEVLIADGVNDARTQVVVADDRTNTVLVKSLPTPVGGWKIAYSQPLPEQENPDAPGLFVRGGCYLRKYDPHGTPCYYWGRLDKEWDLANGRYGRRVVVNFADAPWDLAVDGRSWTTVKDYVQWHEVVQTITGHIIDRYGDNALNFTYSIFNEPDLGRMFWRTSWDELQRYYDYTVDAVLRAFEDRGYDSEKVFIGGLELGAIFGTNMKLKEFLAHCSPQASAKGALPLNAAFADPRLDGKRSRRVEVLCRAHEGKGSPCDFVSVHSYSRSEMMVAKLIRAKEMALAIDEEFYRDLWVNSHENCPDWKPPCDPAAGDLYLGNGYLPTWFVDVAARQLRQAAKDPRYAFGETVFTIWPPVQGFEGINTLTRNIPCDDDGDALTDRTVTIPTPGFHVLTMLSDLGDRYWILPEQQIGGHAITGFASRADDNLVRVVLYSHDPADTQSRSEAAFDVVLELEGLDWQGPTRVEEYRFDREHNTYFREAKAARPVEDPNQKADPERVKTIVEALNSHNVATQRAGLKMLEELGPLAAHEALQPLYLLAGTTKNEVIREHAGRLLGQVIQEFKWRGAYSRDLVEKVKELSECRPTGSQRLPGPTDGRMCVTVRIDGNGLNMLMIKLDDTKKK